MTIRRFKKLVSESEFEFADFQAVPIKRARILSSPLTREFLTSIVRCRLVTRKRARITLNRGAPKPGRYQDANPLVKH